MEMEGITYPDLNSFSRWLPRPNEDGTMYVPEISIEERLFNKKIFWEAKRDGSNVGVWLDAAGTPQVRTRNRVYAQEGIRERVLKLPYAKGIVEFLKLCYACNIEVVIFGEWLPKGRSSARFEMHEQDEFQAFDIWNESEKRWFDWFEKRNICDKYGIPHVQIIDISEVSTLDELIYHRDRLVDFCKQCGDREGVVGKVYVPGTKFVNFFKEKVPDKPVVKKDKKDDDPRPELPDSEIYGAVDKAYMDMPPEQFHDPKYAMPLIVKLIEHECEKHGCKCTKRATLYYKQKIEDLARCK